MSTVYVLGSINEDLIVTCNQLPTPGETILGHEARRTSGGKGANQAVAAARLGAHVQMIGAVGVDDAGRRQRVNLLVNGVGTEHVRDHQGVDTALAVVLVDAHAENSIVVVSGANAALAATDTATLTRQLSRDDLLLAQLEVPLGAVAAGLAAAKKAGARTVLNAAPMTDLSGLLGDVDLLVVNEVEAAMLRDQLDIAPDAPFTELPARARCQVVMTRGGSGAAIATPAGEVTEVLGENVEVVDTTGAGDAFVGALVASLASGNSLEHAVRWANRAGALACTGLGSQTAIPHLNDLDPAASRKAAAPAAADEPARTAR